MGVFSLRDMQAGFKGIYALWYGIEIVLPFWLLQNVLQEQQFKSIEHELFSNSAKKTF